MQNLFMEFEGFILVDRKTPHTSSRKGLIVALDLEKYDFNKGSQNLIELKVNLRNYINTISISDV